MYLGHDKSKSHLGWQPNIFQSFEITYIYAFHIFFDEYITICIFFVVIRDIECTALLLYQISQFIWSFYLFCKVDLVASDILCLPDNILILLQLGSWLYLFAFDVVFAVVQTFIDKPKIIFALIFCRRQQDLHYRLFVVVEQNRFVLLPEETNFKRFRLKAIEYLFQRLVQCAHQSIFDLLIRYLLDFYVIQFF